MVQEIFGVTGHIERVADQFAAEGYLAIAPALFDRQERGVNLAYDEAGIAQGVGYMQQADLGQVMADLQAAIDAVAHAGAVGMVGYCWGGLRHLPGRQSHQHRRGRRLLRRRHRAASSSPCRAARCSSTSASRTRTSRLSDVEKIRAAFPQGEYHTYAAGHGFNCTDRASYDAAAAHLAFARTDGVLPQAPGLTETRDNS